MNTKEPQIIDIFKLLSSSVERSVLEQRIEKLSNKPLLIKNTPRYTLNFLADWLNAFVGKSVNIAVVSSQSQMDTLLKNITKGNKPQMRFKAGGNFDLNVLKNSEYEKSIRVWEEGQYSILGDIVIIWPFGFSNPIRMSLWENEIESIASINPKTFTKVEDLTEFDFNDVGSVEGVQFLQEECLKMGATISICLVIAVVDRR
jgi:transcription-repair coupling factor (superfamily II helicase)